MIQNLITLTGEKNRARYIFPRDIDEICGIRIKGLPRYDLQLIGKCYIFVELELIESYPLSGNVALPFCLSTNTATDSRPLMIIFDFRYIDFNYVQENTFSVVLEFFSSS